MSTSTIAIPAVPRLALSFEEARTSLGVGENKMRELLRSGAVAYVKAGRRVLIRPEALAAYLQAAEGQQR